MGLQVKVGMTVNMILKVVKVMNKSNLNHNLNINEYIDFIEQSL